MPGPKELRARLLADLQSDGVFSSDVKIESFTQGLENDKNRHELWNSLSKTEGAYEGSFEDFTNDFAADLVKKKEVTKPDSATGSQKESTQLPDGSQQKKVSEKNTASSVPDLNQMVQKNNNFLADSNEARDRFEKGEPLQMSDINWDLAFPKEESMMPTPEGVDEKIGELEKEREKSQDVLQRRLNKGNLDQKTFDGMVKERNRFYDKSIEGLKSDKTQMETNRRYAIGNKDSHAEAFGIYQQDFVNLKDLVQKKEEFDKTHKKENLKKDAQKDVAYQSLERKISEKEKENISPTWDFESPGMTPKQTIEKLEDEKLARKANIIKGLEEENEGGRDFYAKDQYNDYKVRKKAAEDYDYTQIEEVLNEMNLKGEERAEVRTHLLQKAKTESLVENAKIRTRQVANELGVNTPDQIIKAFSQESKEVYDVFNNKVSAKMGDLKATGDRIDEEFKGVSSNYQTDANKQLLDLRQSLQKGLETGQITSPEEAEKLFNEKKAELSAGSSELYKTYIKRRTKYQNGHMNELQKLDILKSDLMSNITSLKAKHNITEKDGKMGLSQEYLDDYQAIWQSVINEGEYRDRIKKDAKWEELDFRSKINSSLSHGLLDLTATLGMGVKFFAPGLDAPDLLIDFVEKRREAGPQKDYSQYELLEKFTDLDFLVSTAAEQIPLMLPMVGASAKGYSMANSFLKGTNGLSKTARVAIASMVGGVSSRAVEMNIEGLNMFQNKMKEGASFTEAYDAATRVKEKNASLVFLDAFQSYISFGKKAKLLSTSKGFQKPSFLRSKLGTGKDLVMTFASGASEELIQEYWNEVEFNPMLAFGDFVTSDMGMEIGLTGGIMEAGFAAQGLLGGRKGLADVNKRMTEFFEDIKTEDISLDHLESRSQQLIHTMETLKAREIIDKSEYDEGMKAINENIGNFKKAFNGELPFSWKDSRLQQYTAFAAESASLKEQADNLPKNKDFEKESLKDRAKALDKEVKDLFNNPDSHSYSIDGIPMTKTEFESILNDPENAAQLEGHKVKTDDQAIHAKIINEKGILSERMKSIEKARDFVEGTSEGLGVDYSIQLATKAAEDQANKIIELKKSSHHLPKYREAVVEGREIDQLLQGLQALKKESLATVSKAVSKKEAELTSAAKVYIDKENKGKTTDRSTVENAKNKLEKENEKLASEIFDSEISIREQVKAGLLTTDTKGGKEVAPTLAGEAIHQETPYVKAKLEIADKKSKIKENNKLIDGMKILAEKETTVTSPKTVIEADKAESTREEVEVEPVDKIEVPKKEEKAEKKEKDKTPLQRMSKKTRAQIGTGGFPDLALITSKELDEQIAKNEEAIKGMKKGAARQAVHKQTMALKEASDLLPELQAKAKSLGIQSLTGENIQQLLEEEVVSNKEEDAGLVGAEETKEKSTGKDPLADRERGYRVVQGKKVERQAPVSKKVTGKKSNVTFGTNARTGKPIKVEAEYTVIELNELQPSHKNGSKNQMFFIDEAQPRNRAQDHYREQDAIKGANLDPERMGQGAEAYFGSPVTNERGEIIQGNGRGAALHWYHKNNKDRAEYRLWLNEEAKAVGMDQKDFEGMENPVLVRMTKQSDKEAIRLGNMSAKDLEDVTREGEREAAVLKTVTNKERTQLANIILDKSKNEGTIKQVIRESGRDAMKFMVDAGMVRADERAQYVTESGNITTSGVDFLHNTIRALFFEGTSSEDFTKMDDIHGNIRQGVERAMVSLMSTKDDKALNQEIANIVGVLGDYYSHKKKYPSSTFDYWMNQEVLLGKSPKERLNENEQVIAKFLTMGGEQGKIPTQKEIATRLQDYVDATKATEESLFEKASEGMKKEEAIEKVFGDEKKTKKDEKKTKRESHTPKPGEHYSTKRVPVTIEDSKEMADRIGTGEHASSSDKVEVKVAAIPVAEIEKYKKEHGGPPKRKDIIKNFQKSLSLFFKGMEFLPKVIWNKSRANGALGSTSSGNMNVNVSERADVSTLIHELGHYTDMGLGIVSGINNNSLDTELSKFWDNDSQAPGTSKESISAIEYMKENYPNDSMADVLKDVNSKIEIEELKGEGGKKEETRLQGLVDKAQKSYDEAKLAYDTIMANTAPMVSPAQARKNKEKEVALAEKKKDLKEAKSTLGSQEKTGKGERKSLKELKAIKEGLSDLVEINKSAKLSLKIKGNNNPSQSELTKEISELQMDYKRMEGFAEFMHAWIKNPAKARSMAPKTFSKMQEAILAQPKGENKWGELEKESYETRIWYNLNPFDKMESTKKESIVDVKTQPFWRKQRTTLDQFLNKWGIKKTNGTPSLSVFDEIQIMWTNDKKAMKVSMEKLFKMQGMNMEQVMKTEVDANFYLLTRLMAGQNDKSREMLENSGIRKIKTDKAGNVGYEKVLVDGEPMTIGWLLAPLSEHPNFEKSSKKERLQQLNSDKKIAENLMTSQRTIELDARFRKEAEEQGKEYDENKAITGIGGDRFTTPDFQAAKDFQEYYDKTFNEGTKKRVEEFITRYRKMADQTMVYAMDSGLISKETYEKIKANNQYYVALHRIFEDEIGEVGNAGGYLQGRQPTGDHYKGVKGSVADRGDAVENLIATFYGTINRADQNYINNKFVDILRGNDLNPMPLGKFGYKLDAKPNINKDPSAMVGVMVVWNKGEAEYWRIEDNLAKAFGVLRDLSSHNTMAFQAVQASTKLLEKTIGSLTRLSQKGITLFPGFAMVVNPIRDYGARAATSRTLGLPGSNIKAKMYDNIMNRLGKKLGMEKTVMEQMGITAPEYSLSDKEAEELFNIYGGGQSGYDIYMKDEKHYHKALYYGMKKISKGKRSWIAPSRLFAADNYGDWLSKGELTGRLAEFKSAYRFFKKQGLSDYAAYKRAAFEARDLCDFAVKGTIMQQLKHVTPFINASIQGSKRTMKAFGDMATGMAKGDPTQIARFAMFSALPSIFTNVLAMAMGYEDEYAKLPNWMRDLFWNVKLFPNGVDVFGQKMDGFVSIPKPFEIGMTGSGVERLFDYTFHGNQKAFDGYLGQAIKTFIPFNPTDVYSILGSAKIIVENSANYDSFRDKTLVPRYEESKIVGDREGTKYASSLGKMLAGAGIPGLWEDPRKVDHAIKGWFGYFGKHAMDLSNAISGDDDSYKQQSAEGWAATILRKLKLYRVVPPKNLKSVQKVLDIGESYGVTRDSDFKLLKRMLQDYPNSLDQKKSIKGIISYSEDMQARFEKGTKLYDSYLKGDYPKHKGKDGQIYEFNSKRFKKYDRKKKTYKVDKTKIKKVLFE